MAQPSRELINASQKASQKYGIPASVILAFAGGETSFGTAGMGKSNNNLFGIGNKTYISVEESVMDFASLVTGNKDSAQSKKYGKAIKNASSARDYVEAIRSAGYNSENANYTNLIMGTYNTYNLKQYDVGYDPSKVDSSGDTTGTESTGSSNLSFIDKLAKNIMTVAVVVVLIFLAVLFMINAFSSPAKVAEKVKKGVAK